MYAIWILACKEHTQCPVCFVHKPLFGSMSIMSIKVSIDGLITFSHSSHTNFPMKWWNIWLKPHGKVYSYIDSLLLRYIVIAKTCLESILVWFVIISAWYAGIILGMDSANEKWPYNIMLSLIVHTQIDPWCVCSIFFPALVLQGTIIPEQASMSLGPLPL